LGDSIWVRHIAEERGLRRVRCSPTNAKICTKGREVIQTQCLAGIQYISGKVEKKVEMAELSTTEIGRKALQGNLFTLTPKRKGDARGGAKGR